MKAYTYKDSGIEWLGEIPTHWTYDKLFRLCDNVGSGGTPQSTNQSYYDGDIFWVQSGDLTDGYVYDTKKKINELAIQNSSAKVFPENTLLVAMYGATIGKVGIMTFEGAINQACCALDFSSKIIPKFSYYFMLNARDYLITQAYGGGQQNISQETLKQLHLFYPPIEEQKAIVSFLDKATARMDRIISIKEEQLGQTSRLRGSILDRVLTGGLNDCSSLNDLNNVIQSSSKDNLNIIKLKYITNRIGDGLHATPNYTENEKYLFVNGNNLVDGFIKPKSNTKTVNEDEYSKYKLSLSDNTVLMSINGTIGTLALYNNEEVVFGKSIAYMDALDFVNKKYLMFFLQTTFIKNTIALSLEGTTIKNLSLNTIRNLKVILPTISEQLEIVKYLEMYTKIISDVHKNLSTQIKTLKSYRKSLIHECVTGKKQVADWT